MNWGCGCESGWRFCEFCSLMECFISCSWNFGFAWLEEEARKKDSLRWSRVVSACVTEEKDVRLVEAFEQQVYEARCWWSLLCLSGAWRKRSGEDNRVAWGLTCIGLWVSVHTAYYC